MLRTCTEQAWEHGRVVVFVEPIALYMTRDLHETNDKAWTFPYPKADEKIEVGEFGVFGDDGRELTVVSYGNGYYYSRQAARILQEKHGIASKILDMRWMTNTDEAALLDEIADCKNILIVDECRKTGSWSEWMGGLIAEKMRPAPNVKVIAADDCFIPLGKAAAAGLPSRDEIVLGALKLLNKV
jgi:2-oxoisovalerate dehydrogenase E1 component